MPELSAIIITLNEERNIGRCLDSLQGVADEIIVVDSGSVDKTEAICIEKQARFVFNEWPGYAEQKNFGNGLATYPYILSIDADEALSEELRNAILEVKKDFSTDAYEMNRLTNYCGKWIRHGGWYPDRKLRLFNREKYHWAGKHIHEYLVKDVPDVKEERLTGDLLHYSYYSIDEHVAQANKYTDLTARLAVEKGKKAGILQILINPSIKFLRDYIIRLGFLDGYHGYIVCRISAMAVFMKYTKIRQMRKRKAN
jgi:glycosyltransferase involved in cell wall biosynthesis